jgi:very-short-patch-repair endonuclease
VPIERSFASHPKAIHWSEKNEEIKPRNVYKSTSDKYWFDCPECKHTFDAVLNTITGGGWCRYCASQDLCKDDKCVLCFDKSFASNEKAIHWSEKNGDIKPRNVYKSTSDKYWFDCSECKHTFDAVLNNITKGAWCGYCASQRLCDKDDCNSCLKKSFASNEKAVWWSEKNGIEPRDVFKTVSDKYWFNCPVCEHTFESILSGIQNGGWCGYCASRRLCNKEVDCKFCFEKSFASHERAIYWSKENGIEPHDVFTSTHEKYLFDCPVCEHTFDSVLSSITRGSWCGYCASKRLCDKDDCKFCFENSFASHPKAIYWNKTKNNRIEPRDVFKSSNRNKFWFDCDKCHHQININLNNVTTGHWCPYCVNKTEQKLYDALLPHYPQLNTQYKVEWCMNIRHLPYDFVLSEDKIIIELDGLQHFEQVSNWQSPEETHLNDVYKMKCANENGYSVIRLLQTDVFYDTYDWLNELRENIEKIKLEQRVQNVYMCKDNEYAIFT